MSADIPDPERWVDRPARLATGSAVATAFRRARQATEPSDEAVARVERRGLARSSAGVGPRWWRVAIAAALLATIASAVGAAGTILRSVHRASPPSAGGEGQSLEGVVKRRQSARGRREDEPTKPAPTSSGAVAPSPILSPSASEQPPGAPAPRPVAKEGTGVSSSSPAGRERLSRRLENPTEASVLATALRSLRSERDLPAARAALDRYDRLFPRGVLRSEAQLARTEVLMGSGRRAEALPLLAEFEEMGGTMTRSLLASRGELYAEVGRCSSAMRDFDRVLAGPERGDPAARALYGRASCRLLAGELAAGRRDLELYLASYPRGSFAASARQALDRTP
jgi:hypothetical protein